MSQTKVLAGIVLYNSDYDRLIECLSALDCQVESIILYDNSPLEMEKKCQKYLVENFKCRYIFSGENLGMPEAMNKILEISEIEGYEWVLTMNADSVIPRDLIEKFSPYFEKKEIGMICPQVLDRRRKYMKLSKTENKFINMCITSGTCTRVEAWKQVGKFDGWLFVDLLDNDISKRMILNGWKIYQVSSVVLDQEFGDISAKAEWVEKFWISVGKLMKNDNFAKLSYKKIVHPNRVYYTCRNILYLNKKYEKYGGIGYAENYGCHTFFGFIICFVLPSILRSNKKIEVIKAIIKGFADGKQKAMKTGFWVANPITKNLENGCN